MTDTPSLTRQPPHTSSRTSFFYAEPVGKGLSVLAVLYAGVILLSQLQYLARHVTGDVNGDLIVALDAVLSSAVIGMIAWRSTYASVASVTCLVTSVLANYQGSALVTAWVVTVAVAATATRRFLVAHLLVYATWVVVASMFPGPFDQSLFWLAANGLLISVVAGLTVRYFHGQRRRNEQRVRDLEVLNQRLREDERMALARDLHDVVAHELTLKIGRAHV